MTAPTSELASETAPALSPGRVSPTPVPPIPAANNTRPWDMRLRRLKTTHRLVLGAAGVPSAALASLGILVLASGTAVRDVVFGVLIIGLAASVATGVVVTSILLRREAELTRLQNEFVSRVSHDLRTPLTSIRMFVETLQLGRASDPQTTHECLDALSTETSRLLGMVDHLLDWSRIENQHRVYNKQRTPVASLIDSALAAFETTSSHGDVTIERDVAPDLPDVEVDAAAMVQAMLNLLQNAWHYTPDPKHIAVKARMHHGEVEIAISDNGPGVVPEERGRIFGRFYRGTAARALGREGTGLGLAIVRAIVRAQRGDVDVRDNLPKGSTFIVTLPAADRPR